MSDLIMITDDDIYIGNMLEEILKNNDYNTVRTYSGTETLMALESVKPDLILLDLMLPGISGEEILAKTKDIPIIVVSAKTDIDHKVELLLKGAADYVTKPFDINELLARIKVVLRSKINVNSKNSLTFEDLYLDLSTHTLKVNNKEIHLTKTEFAILKLLMLNSSQVIAKSVMLDRISLDTPDCVESSLKVHISNLRRKLKSATGKEYIETVWGIGFKLKGA